MGNKRTNTIHNIQDVIETVQASGINVVKRKDVVKYLKRYPGLARVLPDIANRVRRSLPDATLLLTVTATPKVDISILSFMHALPNIQRQRGGELMLHRRSATNFCRIAWANC